MGWAVGYDSNWKRDIGYGVPCTCDHPDCNAKIHRGLAHRCGSIHNDEGCGLHFCGSHLYVGVEGKEDQVCERCRDDKEPFEPKPDVLEWIFWKLKDASWERWRKEHPKVVKAMRAFLHEDGARG